MPLSRKGWKFVETLIVQRSSPLHDALSASRAAAKRKSPGSPVAWIPGVYGESMEAFGRVQLQSFIEAAETEGSTPSPEDLDKIREHVTSATRARAGAGSEEAKRIAQATGADLPGALFSELAHEAERVAQGLRRELDIWIARRELQGSGVTTRWWLDDPGEDHDDLLPMPARKAYDRDVTQALADASPDHPLALLFIDIDHFKAVNDEHGHDAGDAALLSIAGQLRATVASRGKAYRCGGEELILLLPNSSDAEAAATAERVRMAAKGHVIPEIKRAVTVSIGVATATSPATSAEELRRRADTAMYAAKKTRDAVVSWHEDLPPKSTR